MTRSPVLEVYHLSKSFHHQGQTSAHRVFKDVSLTVYDREIVSIIGPSGCGKSTLFNIISGTEREDSGRILIRGKKEGERRGQFGYMFQDHLLMPWRTVIQNIMLGFALRGIPKSQAYSQSVSLLHEFQLTRFKNYYPEMLSGGMKQRIALLRTIAFNSSLLLLDEPFGSIDAITRTRLYLYLFRIWKKFNLTVLFTTHDIREALFLSDRVYVLGNKPTCIIREIHVSLPKPRKLNDYASPAFVQQEKILLRLIGSAAKQPL